MYERDDDTEGCVYALLHPYLAMRSGKLKTGSTRSPFGLSERVRPDINANRVVCMYLRREEAVVGDVSSLHECIM